MSSHPLNLAVRFFLELAALAAMGHWGWNRSEGLLRIGLALGIPIIAAALWGIFRVPHDPGPAPVPTPGLLRLALELAFFSLAVWSLYNSGQPTLSLIFGVIVTGHYLLSYDRLLWLVRQ